MIDMLYGGTAYSAQYSPDNWEIKDSYRITNAMDMALICQALINEHPIHGRDMVILIRRIRGSRTGSYMKTEQERSLISRVFCKNKGE